jgi:hypothetical protein
MQLEEAGDVNATRTGNAVLRASGSCIQPLMKITIVAFEGCMTSAVFGQADAFAIAAHIAGRSNVSSRSP